MGANTDFGTADALTKKAWAEDKLFRSMMKSLFFTNMMGTSADSIIQIKNELTKSKGDKITFGLRVPMTGRGQTSSTTGIRLEDNLEAVVFQDFAVTIEEKGNGVGVQSKLAIQRPAFDLRSELGDALKEWATNELETVMLERMLASPSTNRYLDETGSGYGKFTLATLRRLKVKAALSTPKVRPTNVDGKKVFVLLAHEYVVADLLTDDDFVNIMVNAADRGSKNPLIVGADYFVDGVAIYKCDREQMLSSGGVATSLFLGAQAGVIAWAQKPDWNEFKQDAGRLPVLTTDMLVGIAKTVFDSEDYGVIAVDNTYTA